MDDKARESLAFVRTAVEACGEEAGVWYTFRCPICGGEARVCKSAYNGHHAGVCDGCGREFIR